MTPRTIAALAAAALVCVPLSAAAQDSFANQLGARQGQMKIVALNLGVLGAMARGDAPYDAATAQIAANNVVAIGALDQAFNWPEGSDNMSIEGTRALPVIWDNLDDFVGGFGDMSTQAVALAAVAGDGLPALGPALGALGGTCQACHEDYRQPNN